MLGFSQLSKRIKWQHLLEKGKNDRNAFRTGAKIHLILRDAMQPLEDKLKNLASTVTELKSTVEFLDKKYEDVISNKLSTQVTKWSCRLGKRLLLKSSQRIFPWLTPAIL